MTEFEKYLRSQERYEDEHDWATEALIAIDAIISDLDMELDTFALAALMVLRVRAPQGTVDDASALVAERIDEIIGKTDQYQDGMEEIQELLKNLENGE